MTNYSYSLNLYYYPDGTKGRRPKDGERFVSLAGDSWQWDDYLTKWVREYGGNHTAYKPGDAIDFSKVVLDNYSENDAITNFGPAQCQCGKDKHGFAKHARWCDKGKFE